jgi:epoxyqueuosine reductase
MTPYVSPQWLEQLAEHGYRARVVGIDRLRDLQTAIEDAHDQGLVNHDLYERYMTGFAYAAPPDLPEARSVIVVAYPDPPVRFTFTWRGETAAFLVPPTYLHGLAKDERVATVLTGLLSPLGNRLVRARLPVKLLAVRSGLADYGHNNITYVTGLGSFHRLVAFYSELPCERDDWQSPRLLPACKLCRACMKACPVGAVPRDRIRLRAERCITFWNEKDWQVDFPDWMNARGHNALVGCMHCQRVCPENWQVAGRVEEGCAFSESETTQLSDGTPPDALPADLVTKLRQWDLYDLLDTLPRNLRALLDRTDARAD